MMNDGVIGKTELVEYIREEAEKFLRTDLYTLHVPKEKLEWIEEQKQSLKESMQEAVKGNSKAKSDLIAFIESCLETSPLLENEGWNRIWLYYRQEQDPEDRTQMELYFYRKKFGTEGFRKWREKADAGSCSVLWKEEEQKEYLCEFLYRETFGLGKLEQLFDFSLDGISCGISRGKDHCYPVWVMQDGNSLPVDGISLSEEELIRFCRLLASACGEGEFHAERGYMIGELKNHTRCVITRPPFAENWTFFLRRYDSVTKRQLEDLILGENAEEACRLLRLLVKGNQTFGITGMQGSGKTTLLMSLIGEIAPEYTLRILEQVFELHIKELYPERNVLTIRETDTVSGEQGLSVLKKTDGNVTIVGEVADARVAAWMIDAGQAASLFTIFTHHAKTTEALVHALRNSLLSEGIFSKEKVAEEQVVEVLRFNVYLERDRSGFRHLKRISEICPIRLQEENREGNDSSMDHFRSDCFKEEVLLEYRNGVYVRTGTISKSSLEEIGQALLPEERENLRFEEEMEKTGKKGDGNG